MYCMWVLCHKLLQMLKMAVRRTQPVKNQDVVLPRIRMGVGNRILRGRIQYWLFIIKFACEMTTAYQSISHLEVYILSVCEVRVQAQKEVYGRMRCCGADSSPFPRPTPQVLSPSNSATELSSFLFNFASALSSI